jgi:hypothetical protein
LFRRWLAEDLSSLQCFYKWPHGERLATGTSPAAAVAAYAEEAWQTWPAATLTLGYALIDRERVTDGRLNHLLLTAEERRSLFAKIDKYFPDTPDQMSVGRDVAETAVPNSIRTV